MLDAYLVFSKKTVFHIIVVINYEWVSVVVQRYGCFHKFDINSLMFNASVSN